MIMLNKNYDVIVVGAGFAGLTAARELSNKGHKTLILEGRDRMGGRTWVDHRMGKDLEMGGTYVHWFQPHIWAEIIRYNLEIKEVPTLNEAYWIANGELKTGTKDEMFGKIEEGMNIFLKDTMKYFPRPYDPFYEEDLVKEVDHLSVADRLREIRSEVSDEIYELLRAYWSTYFNTDDLEVPGLTQAYRWAALADNDWKMLEDIFELYKIKDGTKALIESIYDDSEADLQLSTPVSVIERMDEGYKVFTRGGQVFTATSVIAAIPINVINNIDFKPALLDEKHQISTEKQSSQGQKVWARVRGLTDTAVMAAPCEFPVNSAHVDTIDGDEGYLMGYISNAAKLDADNPAEVEELFRNWLPHIEVIECTGHNWVEDEFSQGAWPVLRKNQLTKYGKAVRESEEGLFLASSDYADGWAGFMDGAIESGLTTSKRVKEYLQRVKLNLV